MGLDANINVTALASMFTCSAGLVILKDIVVGILFLGVSSLVYIIFLQIEHHNKIEYAKIMHHRLK